MESKGFLVLFGGVPFVAVESIDRKSLMEGLHETVSRYLRQNGCCCDGKLFRIPPYNPELWRGRVGKFPAVDEQIVRRGLQALDGAHHGGQARMVDIELVDFLHVNHGDFHTGYGNIYLSDAEGLRFSLSLRNNKRDAQGRCDFEKLQGIEGIYITNEQINADVESAKERPRLRTKIIDENKNGKNGEKRTTAEMTYA